MWKEIYSIDLNLLIGVVGGIFSGFFVSYVFLIEAEYRNQINHVKEIFTPIYGITATYLAYTQLKKTKGRKHANKINEIDNAGNIVGTSKIIDLLNNYWNELSSFFITYEPWQYKFKLGDILLEINAIISDGKYMIRNSPEDFAEISERLKTCIALFEECERNYKKEILIRVFNSKIVQILLWLFVSMIIILIIAA